MRHYGKRTEGDNKKEKKDSNSQRVKYNTD